MELLEEILDKPNMTRAYKQVYGNKGSAGIDGMPVSELKASLKNSWVFLRAELLDCSYQPSAIKRVFIPKPKGGKRQLGIPTVTDRLIQQAIAQKLSELWEPDFDENSYGFRPRRSAHQCLEQARSYLNKGKTYIVDIDLAKFFDRVNHDILMGLISKKISDKRVLVLIGKYLRTGILKDNKIAQNEEGTPQGSPLSPILSNIMLNELDKELRKRGLSFVRYADDFSIYVRSWKAAHRVFLGIKSYLLNHLKLQVNERKSKCCRSTKFELLGYGFYANREGYQFRIGKSSLLRFKAKLKYASQRRRSYSTEDRLKWINSFTRGWIQYFKLAKCKTALKRLDSWLRSRIRMCEWRLWKRVRTRYKKLKALGFSHDRAFSWACTRKGAWRTAQSPILRVSLSNQWLEKKGYISCLSIYRDIAVRI